MKGVYHVDGGIVINSACSLAFPRKYRECLAFVVSCEGVYHVDGGFVINSVCSLAFPRKYRR